MTLLSPWSAVIAASIVLPLLALLYMLRLRRRQIRIPSTLLWQKSFEDLQANVPFQRLRWSLLLLLQLLVLLALIFALAEPVIRGRYTGASRLVVLIDCSASMAATFPANNSDTNAPRLTRLDAAKQAALELIRGLGTAGRPRQMMIIAFAANARVVSGFESNRDALLGALESTVQTDEQADLDAALQLAGAFSGSSDESAEQPPDVLLLSDGGVSTAGEPTRFSLRSGSFSFQQVVPSAADSPGIPGPVDNVGIASFSVRREYDDPSELLLFARLVNAGPDPVEVTVTLSANDQPLTAIRRTIAAAGEGGPGEESITHALDLEQGAVLTLRHGRADDLPTDDIAAIVLPPPRRLRLALVHPDGTKPDEFLREALAAAEPERLDVISASAYGNLDAQQIDSGALYDMLVFDRVSVPRLPGIGTLTIGGVPSPLSAIEPENVTEGRRILSWDRQHPLMRGLSLDSVLYAGFGAYDLPAGAVGLAHGDQGPLLALVRTRGARHIAVGFELVKSTWPIDVSWAMFVQNAIEHLTLADANQHGLAYRPGQAITIRAASGARQITIDGPVRSTVTAEPGSMLTLPALPRAGLYSIIGAAEPHDRLTLSVLSDVESDIRPRSSLMVNAESVASARTASTSPQALWPWLAGAALGLLIFEWLVYCRRAAG